MGTLFSSEKTQQDIKSTGEINNTVVVEGTNFKIELIEALMIAVIVIKVIKLLFTIWKDVRDRKRDHPRETPTE